MEEKEARNAGGSAFDRPAKPMEPTTTEGVQMFSAREEETSSKKMMQEVEL